MQAPLLWLRRVLRRSIFAVSLDETDLQQQFPSREGMSSVQSKGFDRCPACRSQALDNPCCALQHKVLRPRLLTRVKEWHTHSRDSINSLRPGIFGEIARTAAEGQII